MTETSSVATLDMVPSEYVSEQVILSKAKTTQPRLPIWVDEDNATIRATHLAAPREFQVECFFSSEIVVSGHGLLWLGDSVIVNRSVMPEYWHERLTGHPLSAAERDVLLPVRDIHEPCISALGWGSTTVYGHLLIEMVPRLLLALRAAGDTKPHILLRNDAPSWQKNILNQVGIENDQFITFNPEKERVRLVQGIFPAYVYRNSFHPGVPELLDTAMPEIASRPPRSGVVYASRMNQTNSGRHCLNEKDLIEIAKGEFGVRVIEPETLPWFEQIRIFREAKAVVGLYGSALHTALYCGPDLGMGVIGLINNAQAHIAAVRGQRMAYLVKDVNPFGPFIVKNGPFRALLQAMISAA